MLVLVSGATKTARPDHIGHLIVPKQWHLAGALTQLVAQRFAGDNGCFSGFDEGAFVRMLERLPTQGCLFVTAPDVVADAAATLARWPFWSRLIRGCGFRPAFVAQDGLGLRGSTPWDEMGALFIGGSTAYKESAEARTLCGIAKSRGIWVHWGRVNGKRRYELAKIAGADSIDGTGFSMYPDTNIPKIAEWESAIEAQPQLDLAK